MASPLPPLDRSLLHTAAPLSDNGRPVLRLLSQPQDVPRDFEEALLAFDPDADIEAIIPMPPAIPAQVRSAISRAIGERFEHADHLDAWLHAPCDAIGGATPFERIVAGDGLAVLRALGVICELTTVHQSDCPNSADRALNGIRRMR